MSGLECGSGVCGVGRIDPDVMARNARHQFTAGRRRPFLKMRRHPVGIDEKESLVILVLGEIPRANKSRDHGGQSGGRVAGIFFPPFLRGDRPLQN